MPSSTTPRSQVRAIRISALVSEEERDAITARADAASLSVSAYLRLRALGDAADATPQVLAQVDRLIAGMEADLDAATAALDATLHCLEVADGSLRRPHDTPV